MFSVKWRRNSVAGDAVLGKNSHIRKSSKKFNKTKFCDGKSRKQARCCQFVDFTSNRKS